MLARNDGSCSATNLEGTSLGEMAGMIAAFTQIGYKSSRPSFLKIQQHILIQLVQNWREVTFLAQWYYDVGAQSIYYANILMAVLYQQLLPSCYHFHFPNINGWHHDLDLEEGGPSTKKFRCRTCCMD